MRVGTLLVGLLLAVSLLLQGCAGLQTNLNEGNKISAADVRVMVFPLKDPSYKGRQIGTIGDAFASAIIREIQSTGRACEVAANSRFTANKSIDTAEACVYAQENGYDIAITGVVTEWLDGATQWSGKVDVAAVTVSAYDSKSHKLMASASGRQKGQWFTFVNAPTTRFLEPLSKEVVESLFD